MKALLIAEKPSLRRTIESVYNKHKGEIPYELTCLEQRGHLITLKNPSELDESLKTWSWDTLPIHPEDYGGWSYKVIVEPKKGNFSTAKERYADIKKEVLSGKYDFIINAGDPDQEGELLIRIVLSSIGNKLPIKRFWTNATTEQKVLEALKDLKDDEKDPMLVNLLNAAYARQHSDYRFGMNISRAATLKMQAKVSCGRVKTPILGIVCKREEEIANFVPKTVYGVKVIYKNGVEGSLYEDKEGDEDEENEETKGIVWYEDLDDAQDIINSLSDTARAIKFETKKKETLPPKLYKLATIQIAAGKMGYSSSETLAIIQGMYEKGYVSYPRTDCEYMSSTENLPSMLKSASVVPELAPFVDGIDGKAIGKVKGTKKWTNDKALQESGHSALIPTTKAPDFDNLSKEEKDIYTLICRQFVSIFLPPLVQNKTLLLTDIDGYTFKSTGKTLVDKGYTEIFGTTFSDMFIPPMEENDEIDVDDYSLSEKTSTCPKRFTDADLIAACENPNKYLNDPELKKSNKKFKIGTPATRASIIEELINSNKYLERIKEKKTTYIVPTNLGILIFNNLRNCDICKVDMTSSWEDLLEDIRGGKMPLKELEVLMKNNVTKMTMEIKDTEMTVFKSESKELCDCPKCNGKIIIGTKSYFCSNWQEEKGGCKVSIFKDLKKLGTSFTPKDALSLLEGKEITKKLKNDKGSWDQKMYYDFDTCRTEFVKREVVEETFGDCDFICPSCGKKLKESHRRFICANACGFSLWKTICGKELTRDELKSLLEDGDSGLITGLTSKAGKTFNAHLVLKEDKSGTELSFT